LLVRFGAYSVLHPLGAGGMGSVHLAHQDRLDRTVALKFLSPSLRSDPELVARFRREAECASRLTHPGLPRVYDFGEVDGVPYLAMELVRGRNLAQMIAENGALDPPLVLALARDLLDALAACHDADLLHRDIKPANIMLDKAGRVVLVDLGLAKPLGDTALTGDGNYVGTPRYVPPEVLLGEPPSRAGDIYQVGVVVQEALTGKVLYEESGGPKLLHHIAAGPTPELIAMPGAEGEALHLFVKRCLMRWPAERYADARAAFEALPATTLRPPSGVRRVGPATRPPRQRTVPDPPTPTPAPASARPLASAFAVTAVAMITLARLLGPSSPPPRPAATAPTPAPAAAQRTDELLAALRAQLSQVLPPDAPVTLQSDVRYVHGQPPALVQVRARWRERYRKMLHTDAFLDLASRYVKLAPTLFEEGIEAEALARLLRVLQPLDDLNRLASEAFGREWDTAHVELPAPGPSRRAERPPGLTTRLALRFADAPRSDRPLLALPGILVAPGRAHFNAVDHELLGADSFGEASRWDYAHPLHPTGGVALREAWIGVRVFGGRPTEKIAVGFSVDSGCRRGCEAAFVRGTGGRTAREEWIAIDPRRLADPRVRLILFFEHRGVLWIPEGITLDWLVLAGR
jgi:serine/threonine protein kinase